MAQLSQSTAVARTTLVIFDCDGVLVDSERIANGILAERLRSFGVDIDVDTTIRTFVGRSMRECESLIVEMAGQPLPADFAVDFHARCDAAFETDLVAKAGAFELVERLSDRSVSTCVASSGSANRTRHKLSLAGLASLFVDRVFSGEDVSRNKPAPDLFLHAARRMDREQRECLVVEDTVIGVTAGIAAGMRVVGLAGTQSTDDLCAAGAHEVISELPQLLGLL
jgi:HAD superfamily hydrolase (TIGR01509 family)